MAVVYTNVYSLIGPLHVIFSIKNVSETVLSDIYEYFVRICVIHNNSFVSTLEQGPILVMTLILDSADFCW